MRRIPLGRGAVALVDDADFPWLVQLGTWRLNSSGYAVHYSTHNGPRRTLYMHRLILKPTPGIQVDHINRDRLDNRRENLRFATRSQNQANKGLPINNTSDYKGVSWRKGNGRRAFSTTAPGCIWAVLSRLRTLCWRTMWRHASCMVISQAATCLSNW